VRAAREKRQVQCYASAAYIERRGAAAVQGAIGERRESGARQEAQAEARSAREGMRIQCAAYRRGASVTQASEEVAWRGEVAQESAQPGRRENKRQEARAEAAGSSSRERYGGKAVLYIAVRKAGEYRQCSRCSR